MSDSFVIYQPFPDGPPEGWPTTFYASAAVDAVIANLAAERDAATAQAAKAWAAATDETMVGFHRDMALRLSEDRDILKHRCRDLEGQVVAMTVARDTFHAILREKFASLIQRWPQI